MSTNGSNYVIYELPSAVPISSQSPFAALTVTHSTEGIEYWLHTPKDLPNDVGSVSNRRIPDAKEFWEIMNALIQDSVTRGNLSTAEIYSTWLTFQAMGSEMYERFVPRKLQMHSRRWPKGSSIVIATNEAWIPWEMLFDGEDFWGSKFNLARLPKIPSAEHFSLEDEEIGPRKAKDEISRIVNIIGGSIKNEAAVHQTRQLFSHLSPNSVVVQTQEHITFYQARDVICNADIVHLTCHGTMNGSIPVLVLSDRGHHATINLSMINIRSLKEIENSLVFANACASARVAPMMGEFRNFAWEFYRKGVNAYIGTLGLVPTKYAVRFAEVFYKELLGGLSVGDALRRAKADSHRDNPFWLLYCLYGDPFTQRHYST